MPANTPPGPLLRQKYNARYEAHRKEQEPAVLELPMAVVRRGFGLTLKGLAFLLCEAGMATTAASISRIENGKQSASPQFFETLNAIYTDVFSSAKK